MTRLEDRQTLAAVVDEARADGARLGPACALAGIDPGTLQRWRASDGLARGDRRPEAVRALAAHALSPAAPARNLAVTNEARFADMPPARIVPAPGAEGAYPASEARLSPGPRGPRP